MDLFESLSGKLKNYLPRDGIVNYYGPIFDNSFAKDYLEKLLEKISWKHDEAIMFDKRIVTKRKVAWYGDKPFTYTYSKITKQALPWTKELLELKQLVENASGETFNSCLLNLYHSGAEGVTWHSDAEKDLKRNGAIACLSLGADRKFSFKHKQAKSSISLNLQSGSLLIMKGETQKHWLHSLPLTKLVSSPRVSLTFRTIVSP